MDGQWIKGQMHETSALADLVSFRNSILPLLHENGYNMSSNTALLLSFLESILFFCGPPGTCLPLFPCHFTSSPHLCAFTCRISPFIVMVWMDFPWMDFSWTFIVHHFFVSSTVTSWGNMFDCELHLGISSDFFLIFLLWIFLSN